MTKNLKMKTQEEQKMKIKPFGIIMAFLIVFSSMTTCFAVEYKCLTGYFEGFEGLDDYDEYTNEYGGRIILGGGAEQGSCYVTSQKSYEGTKSLVFTNISKMYNRIKFENCWGADGFSNNYNVRVSFYIYPRASQYATSEYVRVGFYDDNEYKTSPSYSKTFSVKVNEWNRIEFWIYKDTQNLVGRLLGLDNIGGGSVNTVYIDNFRYECFENIATGSNENFDENTSGEVEWTPGGNFDGLVKIDKDIHYGNVGQSLKIEGRNYLFDRVKLNNLFSAGSEITQNDLGKAFRVSCAVYYNKFYETGDGGIISDTETENSVVTNLCLGVYSNATSDNSSGVQYKKEFEVYKNTWTQLDMIYVINDENLLCKDLSIGIDQNMNVQNGIKDLYIDNVEVEPLQDYVGIYSSKNADGTISFRAGCSYQVDESINKDIYILICEFDENNIMIGCSNALNEEITYTPVLQTSTIVAYALDGEDTLRPYTFPLVVNQSELTQSVEGE